MEYIMKKIQTGMTLTAFAMVGAFLALPLLVGDAKANATSKLMNCRYDTRQKVMDCCQRVLRTESKPYWISSGLGSCSGAVRCVGGGKKPTYATIAAIKPKRCFIVVPQDDGQHGGTTDQPTPQRTPNPTSSGKD
jgi:hypothetical protein